jgi:hypothetical protein
MIHKLQGLFQQRHVFFFLFFMLINIKKFTLTVNFQSSILFCLQLINKTNYIIKKTLM